MMTDEAGKGTQEERRRLESQAGATGRGHTTTDAEPTKPQSTERRKKVQLMGDGCDEYSLLLTMASIDSERTV